MSQRRKFDKEFKLMTVELSKSREILDKGEGSFPGNGKPKQTPEEAEIARLKKALKDAEMERDILKKPVSIFSRNDGRYSNS